MKQIVFIDGEERTKLENPVMGTVIEKDSGMAIYMGNTTYLVGSIKLSEN